MPPEPSQPAPMPPAQPAPSATPPAPHSPSAFWYVLAGLLALFVIIGAFYYLTTAPAQAPTSETATTTDSGLQTYADPLYGITLQYPDEFSPVTGAPNETSQDTILWITTPQNTGQPVKLFYVGAWNDPKYFASCTNPSLYSGNSQVSSTTVNGITYLSTTESFADGVTDVFFYTLQNGHCFDIHYDYSAPAEQSTISELQTILNSIRFILPQVSATIDQSSLTTASSEPAITGSATDVSSILVQVSGLLSDGEVGEVLSGAAPVVNGHWTFDSSQSGVAFWGGAKGLSPGTYEVDISSNDNASVTLATGTLTVQ